MIPRPGRPCNSPGKVLFRGTPALEGVLQGKCSIRGSGGAARGWLRWPGRAGLTPELSGACGLLLGHSPNVVGSLQQESKCAAAKAYLSSNEITGEFPRFFFHPRHPGLDPGPIVRVTPGHPGLDPGPIVRVTPGHPGLDPGPIVRVTPRHSGLDPGPIVRVTPGHPGLDPGPIVRVTPPHPGLDPGPIVPRQ